MKNNFEIINIAKEIINRYQTNDPFVISKKHGIEIIYLSNLKALKGMFVNLENMNLILINNKLSLKNKSPCALTN